MKKIYLVIAGAFFILLVITTLLLSLQKKQTPEETKNNLPAPTGVSTQGSVNRQNNNTQFPSGYQQPTPTPIIEPIETLDFKAAYVSELDKVVVEQKTPQAKNMFNQWLEQNKLTQTINNQNILFTDKKIIPTPSDSVHKLENTVKNFFQLMDDLNNIGKGSQQSSNLPISQSPSPSSKSPNLPISNSTNPSMTYFAQCGDQGSLALPNGCNMCSAGCGAASVAMIASSYLGNQYNLKAIVDLYKKNNYLLGCDGSRYSDAHELLKSFGLKTTDYLVFDSEKSDTVVPQLRKYLSAGWTFFTLASFCEKGCGHYFWITDIDAQGNIWAYDPAYGRYQIPYNENSRYPYPLYKVAFGVKK